MINTSKMLDQQQLTSLKSLLTTWSLPAPNSHKGQNGKLLLIGGSELFHAASRWSLEVAAKIVDMVFYSSVTSNNQLIFQAKSEFWNGIVVPREQLHEYFAEAQVILIGPGMTRDRETAELLNKLMIKHPQKHWVIDAGALQMLNPKQLDPGIIITPHQGELQRLLVRAVAEQLVSEGEAAAVAAELAATAAASPLQPQPASVLLQRLAAGSCWLIKGEVDVALIDNQLLAIPGGNSGMTKGGTGDVLAGLVAALYCTQSSQVSVILGSVANKLAGEQLWQQVGPYFGASELAVEVPKTLWKLNQSLNQQTRKLSNS